MTRPHSLSTRALAALAVSLVLLTGCTADLKPSPSPTPTPLFASKKDAFAAAEATYRAYNDALNLVDPADPATFEAVFERTTGDFQAVDRKNLSVMHAEELTVSGANTVVGFHPLRTTATYDEVRARICVDVSSVQIVDARGASRVAQDRAPIYVADVTFVWSDDAYLISRASKAGDSSCG
ncbi:hypothetical protein [Microbacterium sp. K35]|uniref:hypothetical protein n=1 Tax=Microbacterium sp. K35 TaxID=2305440 RepID=UPI00109B9951|nr:hypothetical protein [Microbacterium sp. K35]